MVFQFTDKYKKKQGDLDDVRKITTVLTYFIDNQVEQLCLKKNIKNILTKKEIISLSKFF